MSCLDFLSTCRNSPSARIAQSHFQSKVLVTVQPDLIVANTMLGKKIEQAYFNIPYYPCAFYIGQERLLR